MQVSIKQHVSHARDNNCDVASSTERIAELERELSEAREKIDNLELGLRTSREIGMAVGIVMARRNVAAEQAWRILVAASQQVHRKVREIASDVVYVGDLYR